MATNGNTTGFVVWEWLNEHGRWRPYDSNATCQIENHYGKSNQVYLGSVDQSLCMYLIDFSSLCQIRQGSGTARPVRRKVYPLVSQFANQITWQWSGDYPGSWHTYEFDVSSILEDCYMRGQNLLDLSSTSLQLPYYINISTMQQVRIETGTIRGIRRHNLSTAYPLDFGKQVNVTVQQQSMPVLAAASSTSAGASKRPNVSSDSDSDSGLPNGSLRHKRYSRKRSKGHQPSTSRPQTTTTLNIPSRPSPLGHSVVNILASNSISQGYGPPTKSVSLPQPLNMGTVPMPNSSLGGYASVNLSNNTNLPQLPQNSIVPSTAGQLFPGPVTRRRYQAVNAGGSAQNMISGSGFMPMSSAMFSNSVPISLSHLGGHPSFIPSASNSMNHLPLPLGVAKGRTSRISPGVSNMTNALVSPAVPVAFSVQKSSSFGPSSSSSSQSQDATMSGRIVLPKLRKSKPKTAEEVMRKYLKLEDKPPEEEDCCICYDKLHEESSYGNTGDEDHVVVSLAKCKHKFHRMCLHAMYNSGHKDGSIQCPTCKTIYGERLGNCPPGEMEYETIPHSLPGHPNCQAIRIVYQIHPGVQGPDHPNPGKRYSARGFPRVAYLPDDDKGRKVLQLLTIAWQRRLMFTIGMSTTTGEGDTVTWNEIHHKTEFGSNVSGHGYPDPNYMDNVTSELAVQGVTEDDL